MREIGLRYYNCQCSWFQDTVPLRCVNFSRTEFDKALAYLKPRVCIRRDNPDDSPSVFTTGVGGAQFAKEIQKTFDIKYGFMFLNFKLLYSCCVIR